MALTFNTYDEIEKRREEIYELEEVKKHHNHINQRLEDRLLHSVTVRDEIRRGVRISDEDIEVTIFEWLKRLLFKMDRKVELEASIKGIKGTLYVDALDGTLFFEPTFTVEEFKEHLKTMGFYKDTEVFSYPLNNRALSHQVLSGETTAFNHLEDGKEYPEHVILTYSDGRVVGLVRKVKEEVLGYGSVPKEHSRKEAQGDHSHLYWQLIHDVLYRKTLKEEGKTLEEDTPIYRMEFELVESPGSLLKKEMEG